MNNKVFISGSITITQLPDCIEDSIRKIKDQNLEILVGDADGIDTLVQDFCKILNYSNVTVYSIYSSPRYKVPEFNKQYIAVKSDTKKERERQKEKDSAMTQDSDYSLVIWDGKSKGSYQNILRALENKKKIKVYLHSEEQFLATENITYNEIEDIYRKNNGYSAKEVVEHLKGEGEDYFQSTRAFNKCLIEHGVLKKEGNVYHPMQDYSHLFMVNKYKGKITGVRFTNQFISWIKDWVEEIKPPEQSALF